MNKYFFVVLTSLMFYACGSNSQTTNNKTEKLASGFVNNYTGEKVKKTEVEWKEELNEEEYYVIRKKGTERAFTGPLLEEKRDGIFECRACGLALFESTTKFKSGTGWPSFYAPISDKCLATDTDYNIGYARTEIMCGRCEGHLGHVFPDGPKPTGQRYCLNSLSLTFEPTKKP